MINYFTHAFTYKYFSSTMNYHFFKYTQITRKKNICLKDKTMFQFLTGYFKICFVTLYILYIFLL